MNGLRTRLGELAELVKYHSDLYYNKAAPEVTDAEFDVMVSELKDLVEQAKTEDSQAEQIAVAEEALAGVGSMPSYGRKVTHSQVMGSLDKETTVEAVLAWAEKYQGNVAKDLVVTPKIDGTAIRLNYVDGKLVEAATRGDGQVGQDVTDNVKAMRSVPKTLRAGLTVEVRGEVYMKKSVFKKLAASGVRAFANPRNAAAGSLMAKDPKDTGERDLSLYVYDAIQDERRFSAEQEKRAWMAANLSEFELVPMAATSFELFEGIVAEWEKDRPSLDFLIDGLVVALESLEDQEEAGWNGKRPRGKMAYKFAPEQKKAKVVGIDWQVGRTGKLTPMCRIEPTLVDGSTISNLTLHNAARVRELRLDIGDEVLIEKCGDVIPGIVCNLSNHE